MNILIKYNLTSTTDIESSNYSPITSNDVTTITNSLLIYDPSNPTQAWNYWQDNYYPSVLIMTNQYYISQLN